MTSYYARQACTEPIDPRLGYSDMRVRVEPTQAPLRPTEVMMRSRLVLVLTSASLIAVTGCEAATAPSTVGPAESSEATTSASATTSVHGAAAVWHLKPGQNLQRSSTTFTALVWRLGCNSGVTGEVLAPEIDITEAEAVVTFRVAPMQSGGRCQSNERVPYEVNLGEPLQDRAIVDGQCLPGGEAAATADCIPGPTRFSL